MRFLTLRGEEAQLAELAEKAIEQIEYQKYDEEMKRQGVSEIVKYGVAFSGKKVEVAVI